LIDGREVPVHKYFPRALSLFVVFSLLGYVLGVILSWISRKRWKQALQVMSTAAERNRQKFVPRQVPAMIRVAVEDLEPGMKLAESLSYEDGIQLAVSGTILRESTIEEMRKTGITSVRVEGIKYLVSDAAEPEVASDAETPTTTDE